MFKADDKNNCSNLIFDCKEEKVKFFRGIKLKLIRVCQLVLLIERLEIRTLFLKKKDLRNWFKYNSRWLDFIL